MSVTDVTLIRQSEGGMIAQEVCRILSWGIHAIITSGASPIMIPCSNLQMWLLNFSTTLIKLWPYENFMKSLALRTSIKKDVQEHARQTVQKISKKDFLAVWSSVTTSISNTGISGIHISVPLLINYGDADTTGTVKKNNQQWKEYEPNAKLVIIPEADHSANQDNFIFFNEVMLKFFRKIHNEHTSY